MEKWHGKKNIPTLFAALLYLRLLIANEVKILEHVKFLRKFCKL